LYENSRIDWAIFCFINNIKVDIAQYKHPQIEKTEEHDGFRLYSNLDLIAMKINSVLGRGKKKDFYDLAELFKHYSLQECMNVYKKKFPSQELLISIPNALTYFANAVNSEDPESLKGQTRSSVKKTIQKKVSDYLK